MAYQDNYEEKSKECWAGSPALYRVSGKIAHQQTNSALELFWKERYVAASEYSQLVTVTVTVTVIVIVLVDAWKQERDPG